ncbi:MAG: peptidoglycan-associated lipoprotein Pal [Steroidobacteraceae bacterium]
MTIDPRHASRQYPSSRMVLVAALVLAMTVSACKSKPPVREPSPEPVRTEPRTVSSDPMEVATVTPQQEVSNANLSTEERAAREALEREGMVIYFEYDSSLIKPEVLPLLASHARYLNRFRNTVARLEGHTDERGSREYNIGLGERRAQAVRKALELQGVAGTQLGTVSYGEERPAALGSNEGSYSRNRRVEIHYAQ